MSVELTSPVCGLDTGDTYSGDLEEWLVASGYAKRDGEIPPIPEAGLDPTLAENREVPGEKPSFLGSELDTDSSKEPVETGAREPKQVEPRAVPHIGESTPAPVAQPATEASGDQDSAGDPQDD